ncbi:MAG: hypothetical protein IPK10_09155 [Bacteroidetes bacterium]|nr:hypothetical protein [Bacteroidota bacterium]
MKRFHTFFNQRRIFMMCFILSSWMVLLCSMSSAQAILSFRSIEANHKNVLTKAFSLYVKSSKNGIDSLVIINQLRKSLTQFHESGYLEARLDSISKIEGKVAWWTLGPLYKVVEIKTAQEDDYLLSNGGRLYPDKVFSPEAYSRVTKNILNFSTNNGYPFALVRLDSLKVNDGKLTANLVVDRGNLVLLDTALIKGSAKVSPAYLNNYLGIKPGSVFNESILGKVSTRLKEILFLLGARSFEIEFTKDRAREILLEEQSCSI